MSHIEANAPASVADYSEAVSSVGGGQFTTRFREDGRTYFASLYGAPFFALSRLAPELQGKSSTSLLISDPGGWMAADGGRWLSLYAKVLTTFGKISCTVCAATRPRPIKAPRPLLFQPPQQVLVKSWIKHLHDLDVPPDVVVVYAPDGLDETEAMIESLCQLSKGRKALLGCDSLVEALFVQFLLQSRGCQVSEVCGFAASEGQPQDFDVGAWWVSAVPPTDDKPSRLDERNTKFLRLAYQSFRGFIRRARSRDEARRVAALYGTRTTEAVGGEENINAVRLTPGGGIDLATGRFFSLDEASPGGAFSWEDKTLSADLLATAPKENPDFPPGEDRLDLIFWLGAALTEDVRRELGQVSDSAEAPDSDEYPRDEAPEAEPNVVRAPTSSEVSSAAPPQNAPTETGSSTVRARRSRLSRSAGTVNVLALAARLGKADQDHTKAFDAARSRILAWLRSKGFAVAAPSDSSHIEAPGGEVSIETDGQSIWSLRFDDRRSMEEGAIWRVEATLLGQPNPAIGLRLVQVRSTEEAPPPVASGVPHVVATLAKEIGLEDAGVALLNSAVRLSGDRQAQWLLGLLLNPNRTQSVIVISGSVDASADRLAARLAGVAHVICIDGALSNRLIRSFGRDRSVYGSAVRLYRPGFAAEADPYQHPVWTLKGTQLPKWLATDIFEEACAISLEVGDLDERAPSFQAVRNHLAKQRLASSEHRLVALREQVENIASSKDEQISQLQAIRDELESSLAEYRATTKELGEQSDQLRDELQATRRERDAALEEARQLRYQLSNQWEDDGSAQEAEPADDSYYPDNWDELETWVEIYGEDKLVLHPKAAKAARESPFKDIPLAYKAMEYLVQCYIPMRTRTADDSEAYERSQQALAELGLEESDVGTAKDIKRYKHEYRRQYDGREVTLDRHLKSGVGFGGDFQFRLYFYYDDEAEKVLVGHMPTHLTNRLSHNG